MIFVWLLVLIPVSLALGYLFYARPIRTFISPVGAIGPPPEWTRRATEHLAARATPAVGGLLNVTFGNTAEFVLALFVLAAGHSAVVKGEVTGSILGNTL